jgi:enoyl-CoA hydratase
LANEVLCETKGPVAIVTLNRPEKRNAINRALALALQRTMETLDADDAVRAIVLTGAGDRAFCAGADMGEQVERLEGRLESIDGPSPAYTGILGCSKPVIAAVNGFAYGGGALLASNCDIRLAAPAAKFRFVGASYGLVVGGTQLPRIVGPAHAKELIFTTRVIDAGEAERIGLVNHVIREGSVVDAAVAMAEEIAANSPYAVAWAKKVIDAATEVDKGAEVDAEANRVLRGSDDNATRFKAAASNVVTSLRRPQT